MTPQENELLQKFLAQLAQAHVSAKDPEAEAMIRRAVAQQPDAAYLLVQRALLLEHALQQAKSQLARLNEQRDGAGSQTWTHTPSSTPAMAPAPASPPQAQAAPQNGGTNSGWGGFLGNAATTAAGVAGGAFLFQGLEDLLGHRGGGGGFLGGSAPTETVENVTVNDYSGDGESSEFASADDSDTGLDGDQGDDFGDDSSWT